MGKSMGVSDDAFMSFIASEIGFDIFKGLQGLGAAANVLNVTTGFSQFPYHTRRHIGPVNQSQ